MHEQLRLAHSLPQRSTYPLLFMRDVGVCQSRLDRFEMRVDRAYGSDCGSVACLSND